MYVTWWFWFLVKDLRSILLKTSTILGAPKRKIAWKHFLLHANCAAWHLLLQILRLGVLYFKVSFECFNSIFLSAIPTSSTVFFFAPKILIDIAISVWVAGNKIATSSLIAILNRHCFKLHLTVSPRFRSIFCTAMCANVRCWATWFDDQHVNCRFESRLVRFSLKNVQ